MPMVGRARTPDSWPRSREQEGWGTSLSLPLSRFISLSLSRSPSLFLFLYLSLSLSLFFSWSSRGGRNVNNICTLFMKWNVFWRFLAWGAAGGRGVTLKLKDCAETNSMTNNVGISKYAVALARSLSARVFRPEPETLSCCFIVNILTFFDVTRRYGCCKCSLKIDRDRYRKINREGERGREIKRKRGRERPSFDL